jgi:hypothetical protein
MSECAFGYDTFLIRFLVTTMFQHGRKPEASLFRTISGLATTPPYRSNWYTDFVPAQLVHQSCFACQEEVDLTGKRLVDIQCVER